MLLLLVLLPSSCHGEAHAAVGTTEETANQNQEDRSSLRRGLRDRDLGWFGFGSGNSDDDKKTSGVMIPLIESVPCEPDHGKAVKFVERFGNIQAGNEACAAHADPNSCASGCCRFGTYFFCDVSNAFTDLPCVCNRNTAANHPHRGHDHTAAEESIATADENTTTAGVRDGEESEALNNTEEPAEAISPKDEYESTSPDEAKSEGIIDTVLGFFGGKESGDDDNSSDEKKDEGSEAHANISSSNSSTSSDSDDSSAGTSTISNSSSLKAEFEQALGGDEQESTNGSSESSSSSGGSLKAEFEEEEKEEEEEADDSSISLKEQFEKSLEEDNPHRNRKTEEENLNEAAFLTTLGDSSSQNDESPEDAVNGGTRDGEAKNEAELVPVHLINEAVFLTGWGGPPPDFSDDDDQSKKSPTGSGERVLDQNDAPPSEAVAGDQTKQGDRELAEDAADSDDPVVFLTPRIRSHS